MGADGKLIFGTNYGLTIIDPKKIPTERLLSPIVITGLSVNGIQVKPNMPGSPLQESLAYSDKITLKYFQNSFMLDFLLLIIRIMVKSSICIGWKTMTRDGMFRLL